MADEEEPKKKSGLLKIILLVVGAFVVLGIGLGAGYFMFGSQKSSPEQLAAEIIERNSQQPNEETADEGGEEEAAPEKVTKDSPKDEVFQTLYFEFPGTLTTNLQNSRRFLQIGIGISTQYDNEILTNVEAHMPAVKAALLVTLSDYGEEDVVGSEARKALAEDLKNAINAEMERLEGFGGVEGVHLTSYVMQ